MKKNARHREQKKKKIRRYVKDQKNKKGRLVKYLKKMNKQQFQDQRTRMGDR